MKTRPILHPPVQVSHLYYRLTRVLVWGGFTRYYSMSGVDGADNVPKAGTPAIFIGNHQNGMMDPMPFCGFVPQQVHWLTRADVFWNPVARHILYGYNQMPVYRQRDRVDSLRERNDVIFDVCVDRMHAGAAMGIFPEGNHNPFPSLRPLKGGLAEMLARSAQRHSDLTNIEVVPVGLDYEHFVDWRRRFRLRIGAPVRYADLLDKDGSIDKPALNERIRDAFRKVMVDIQPSDAQPYLHPAMRAERTTQLAPDAWDGFVSRLQSWETKWTSDEGWRDHVKRAFDRLQEAQQAHPSSDRPEAWGKSPADIRNGKPWALWIRPLTVLANLPTWPAQTLVKRLVQRTVKKTEFVPTMRLGYGILALPCSWLMFSAVAGLMAPTGCGWACAGAMWLWGQAGSRLHDWSVTQLHDHRDAVEGHSFWHEPSHAKLREAWTEYLKAVNN